jgi:glyoxylase-like metal-dependent hydrolase (beta-lactamase superfamily II)
MVKNICVLATAMAGISLSLAAQTRPQPPSTPRIYVFDNGGISGLDVKLFNFAPEEIKEPNFVNVSYLVVHPKGTLMFDAGGIPDADFKADGTPVTEGILTASKRLVPQLAAAGYRPSDITYFAMSHYHSDHTANANAFAGATWIVQKADRDHMFQEKPAGIIRPAHYDKLKGAKTRILNNEDLDVFGDGTVVVMSTPGHTPGHQVLFVRLAKTGPVVLAGDLYHYPEEIATGRTPTFEFNVDQTKVSRARIQAFVEQSKAQLWIEHDIATHAKLPKAPGFVE